MNFVLSPLLNHDSSARGNTSLESAVSLTKALRWDIQSLALRLSKAANAEEASRRNNIHAKTRTHHEAELRLIVEDIRKLLLRIEDAVPLINLAITTSGASLSTALPASVSPSRLLQASTFLTAGDTQFSIDPNSPVQVGPTFTLSAYMLFAGHSHRANVEEGSIRDTTWKEVIHKARVKLLRIPLAATYGQSPDSRGQSDFLLDGTTSNTHDTLLLGGSKANEFAYRLEIIEDLDDDRLHSFEDDEPQPGPYKDVQFAGIREFVPIHEISKIFYADTGKILNIGTDGESNNPVLLLKRDVNALSPRRMMEQPEHEQIWQEEPDDIPNGVVQEADKDNETEEDDPQLDVDHQLRRESLLQSSDENPKDTASKKDDLWRFSLDLDPEWLAFEVYTETEDSSSGDEQEQEQDPNDDSAYVLGRPSSAARITSSDSAITTNLANLHLDTPPPPSASKSPHSFLYPSPKPLAASTSTTLPPFGAIRTSLSLLEMLIRLTALQQFQQASHLSIPDELLTFFLEESSTTGAGGDGDERRRKRHEARRKVGFDPYDESPVKKRGEEYLYHYQNKNQNNQGQTRSSTGTPQYEEEEFDDSDGGRYPDLPRRQEWTTTPQPSPGESWLLRSSVSSSIPGSGSRYRHNTTPSDAAFPSSPQSPYASRRTKAARPLERVQHGRAGDVKVGSPLGRGMAADTDSSLGTSPGTPPSDGL